jgi:hypothetical protein
VDIQSPPVLKRPWNPADIFASYTPTTQRSKRPRRSKRAAAAVAGAGNAIEIADAPGADDAAEDGDAAEAGDAAESPEAADTPPATTAPAIRSIWPQMYRPRLRRVRNPVTGELEVPQPPSGFDLSDASDDDDGGRSPDDDDDDEAGPEEEQEDDDPAAAEDADEPDEPDDGDEEGSKLQLLDVGSARPLLAHRGKVYACRWATPLGTDVYFARRKDLEPDDDDDQHEDAGTPPAGGERSGGERSGGERSGGGGARSASIGASAAAATRAALVRGEWALLGTSAARLIAEPADIEYRARPAARTAAAEGERRRGSGDRPFFERLVEIKRRLGEVVPPRLVRMWAPGARAEAETPSDSVPDGAAGAEEAQSGPGAADGEGRGDLAETPGG